MSDREIVVFDIIGTCFSLEKPRQQLIELGAPDRALELWFAQALRDAFALSHAGGYKPLKEVLQAELPRTLKSLKIDVGSSQVDRVINTFKELDLQPKAKEAFETLTQAGKKIVALTNGSKDSTYTLLERAGVKQYFSEVYSVDAIAITKPHPDVYRMIPTDDLSKVWLIAAHAWDIAGGEKVGMKTAFVKQLEGEYLNIYSHPQIIVEDLAQAAHQIIEIDI